MLRVETLEHRVLSGGLTKLDVLRNLASPPGGVAKRLLRMAFFVLSSGVRRLPGFAALSAYVRIKLPDTWIWLNEHETAYQKLARRPRFKFDDDAIKRTRGTPVHKVHQFHSGSAKGDAITNSMFLMQRALRDLGVESEIFVEHRDPELADRLLEIENLPLTSDYVLIVHHSIGYDICDRIAAMPVNKILMYHNVTPPELLQESPVLAKYAALGRAQLDLLRDNVVASLADSEYNARELREKGFISPSACPLLVDVDELLTTAGPPPARADKDPFTVLFVGRIVASKGQADLVDAFAEFRKLYERPARLVLIGRSSGSNDPYLSEIKRRVAQSALGESVILTGAVSDIELRDWYRAADLYVSLSQHEGFGVPLIEAMAHGVPILAWPGGAIAETLGASATLLSAREPLLVAAAMLELARDCARRSDQAIRQFRSLDRFRLSNVLPTLMRALATAGAERPPFPTSC